MSKARILYLDQNKWIDLARSIKHPDRSPQINRLLEQIVIEAEKKRLIIPLSFANLYETLKINNPEQRSFLGWVQATLSQGIFFRSRKALLKRELIDFFIEHHSLPKRDRQADWFLTNLFFECAADYDPRVFGFTFSEQILELIRSNPTRALFSYLTDQSDEIRRESVRMFSIGSQNLIQRLEQRRAASSNEAKDLRFRIYGAALIKNDLDLISEVTRELGIEDLIQQGGLAKYVETMIAEISLLNIEQQLVVKTETEARAISENDTRDLLSFCICIAYSDILVGEKAFVNRSSQAKLDQLYGVRLFTKLTELEGELVSLRG